MTLIEQVLKGKMPSCCQTNSTKAPNGIYPHTLLTLMIQDFLQKC